MTSPLRLAAFSTTAPALPARCSSLQRAGEPPRRCRGLAARRCCWLVGPIQQQPCRHPNAACGQATRRGDRRWPSPGQAQAQLATAKPCHRPRPSLAGTGHSPLCFVSYRRRLKNTCCKLMFQMFQRYVTSISDGCCKSRLG
jgi:hypothetical protein